MEIKNHIFYFLSNLQLNIFQKHFNRFDFIHYHFLNCFKLNHLNIIFYKSRFVFQLLIFYLIIEVLYPDFSINGLL